MPTKTGATKVADSYLNLVRELPLASIRTEAQYGLAQEMIDHLLTRGRLDRGERMYLDALSDLLAAYEDLHHSIPAASDADMLRHLLEAKGVSAAALQRRTKLPKKMITEVLAGKQPFTPAMARTLARFFKVDVSVLGIGA